MLRLDHQEELTIREEIKLNLEDSDDKYLNCQHINTCFLILI